MQVDRHSQVFELLQHRRVFRIVEERVTGSSHDEHTFQTEFGDRAIEFVDRMIARANTIVVGPTRDWDTDLGPVIDAAQRDRILSYIEGARGEGATVAFSLCRMASCGLPARTASFADSSCRVSRDSRDPAGPSAR